MPDCLSAKCYARESIVPADINILKAMNKTIAEKTLEARLVSKVKASGGVAYKFTSPSHRGVPDRMVLMPGAHIIFVEMKSPGKRPTSLQQLEIDRLRMMGFRVLVIDSAEGVDEFINSLGL